MRYCFKARSMLVGISLVAGLAAGAMGVSHAESTPAPAVTDEGNNAMAQLYHEALRPQFHFTATKNWLNDPNGLVYYKGEYHLFFQHNPSGIDWGNMTWGHAISTDLLHWKQLPNAIEPDQMGTIYSGSAVVDENNTAGFQKGDEKTLVAIYTAAGVPSDISKEPFVQCIATSNDRGRTWAKYEGNPVLPFIVDANRDPKVVWHEPTKKWVMALFLDGCRYGFFSSPDLKQWTLLHDMNVPECGECPDFFEIPLAGANGEKKWVFTAANGRYLVGAFDGQRFTSETPVLQVEYGANCYAVQTYSDIPESDGRRIQIGWMRDGKYPGMLFNQQMSFPCELKLLDTPQGMRLTKTPVREIELLHKEGREWKDLALQPGENPLAGLEGELWDIRMEIEPGEAAEAGIKIRGQAASYHVKEKTLTCLGSSAPLNLSEGRIQLQILVDRASIEVFANGGQAALSSCFLPPADDQRLELYAVGAPVRVISLEAYPLHSVWP